MIRVQKYYSKTSFPFRKMPLIDEDRCMLMLYNTLICDQNLLTCQAEIHLAQV